MRWFLMLCLLSGGIVVADIVYLSNGGRVKGKIVEEDDEFVVVETEKFGRVKIEVERVSRIERGTDEEIYQQRLKRLDEDDLDGHMELALWARSVGLEERAKERFRHILRLDRDNYYARRELGYHRLDGEWVSEREYYTAKGYVRYEGRWIPKADADMLKAGYVRYGEEWVKKEHLDKIRRGYRLLNGKWVSKEEYYRSKGWVEYDGRWMSKEKAARLKRREEERRARLERMRLAKQIKDAFKIKCTFVNDAARSDLERFGGIVQKASERIWDMTGGACFIEEATITDKAKDGFVVVLNNNDNKVQTSGGKTVYGYCSGGRMYVGGNCFLATFVHEFGHAKFGLPDHYGETVICIMNASSGAKYMRYWYCDNCWKKVDGRYGNSLKRPSKPDEDFGEPPETKVIIVDK